MTMHLSWMFCHPRLGIAVINLHTKSEVMHLSYTVLKLQRVCRKLQI